MKKKKPNQFFNLLFNIIIPVFILTKGDDWMGLSVKSALIIALVFPFIYGIVELFSHKKVNAISVIGIISILLTGGIAILELPSEWVAVKEASVPLIIGLLVIVSLKTPYPLIKTLVYNDTVLDTDKIESTLHAHGKKRDFEALLKKCTFLVAGSFLLSAVLNFSLAEYFIQSPTGTQAFNEELAKMTAWSFPMIALPCSIFLGFTFYYLAKGITRLTGLSLEEMFHSPEKHK